MTILTLLLLLLSNSITLRRDKSISYSHEWAFQEWALHNTPKPYAFSYSLQYSSMYNALLKNILKTMCKY